MIFQQMAQQSLLLLLLLHSALCQKTPTGKEVEGYGGTSEALVPFLCIILGLVILVLCLVGLCFFCMSAFFTFEDDLRQELPSGGSHVAHKDVVKSVCNHDPPSQCDATKTPDLEVTAERKEMDDGSCAIVINMEPYGSKFKQTVRSLLQEALDHNSLKVDGGVTTTPNVRTHCNTIEDIQQASSFRTVQESVERWNNCSYLIDGQTRG